MEKRKPFRDWVDDELEKDPKLKQQVDINEEKLRVKGIKQKNPPKPPPLTRN